MSRKFKEKKTKMAHRILALSLAVLLGASVLIPASEFLAVQAESRKASVSSDSERFDYTTVPVGEGGFTAGKTTEIISTDGGIITGKTGSTSDPTVLTLDRGASGNTYMLKSGEEYTFRVTYRSAAKLMFFIGDWTPVLDPPQKADDWKTISVDFKASAGGTMPIYIQNWGGDTPEGDFQIKEMYILGASTVNFDFIQYDYANISVGKNGFRAGSTTNNVTAQDGVITGKTGSTSDVEVLTLETGVSENDLTLKAGEKYRFSVTYQSAAKLMFFVDDWVAVASSAMASEDWMTISGTFTMKTGGKLRINIQNWGGETPEGDFQIKEMFLSRESDRKVLKTGTAIGNLPSAMISASDSYHKMAWFCSGTQITENTVYTGTLGAYACVQEAEKNHHLKKTEGREADCSHDGWKEYYVCQNADCVSGDKAGFYYDSENRLCSFADLSEWQNGIGKIATTGKCSYTMYQKDAKSHWLVCPGCLRVKAGSKISHTCNQKVQADEYLKENAACSHATVYYRSCVCGYCDKSKSTKTFTVGEKLSHTWSSKGATPAKHRCTVCGASQEHDYKNDICTVCGYDMKNAVQFVQYDYTDIALATDGWQAGSTTKKVKNKNGVISGQSGSGADVLTLQTSEKNTFVMKKGVKYRLSITYRSDAALMLFCDNWIALTDKAEAAASWKTVTATVTPDTARKLTIYVQNWDGQVKKGNFQIKEIYLSKVADAKEIADQHTIGRLPAIDRTADDRSHTFAWVSKNTKTGKTKEITAKTKYVRSSMGNVFFAVKVLVPHSKNAHWWTKKGATVTKHVCSECSATQKHTYVDDICTVCGYDLGKAVKYNLCNYTTVAIGQGGWETGSTTKNVTYQDGAITGKTGKTTDPAVLSLYAYSDLNPYVMEKGTTYRVSVTYKSKAALMIFCDEWKNFTGNALAAEDWKTLTLTFTPNESRKLAIYIQNWDHDHPVGSFSIKDITIAKISDSKVLKDGQRIGTLPELTCQPTDEFHEFVWYIKKKSGNGYMKITPQTTYRAKTMGREILPIETKLYHTVLNYVRCDMQETDSWVAGEAVKTGGYTHKDGVIRATLKPDSVGKTALSFSDGKGRLELESGVIYKVILTYRSDRSFGVFMNLKSNAWTEAPGKCLPTTDGKWKTVTATFKSAAGDTFNGALVQSWNDGKEYTLEIKDFCIVKDEDTRKFAGNESVGTVPSCQGEDDALGRYVYQWNLYKENKEALTLSSNQTIHSLISALGYRGAFYAKEEIRCVYHMDDGQSYGKAATCTTGGWSPYWICKTCKKAFSDQLCKNEIKDVEAWKKGAGKLEKTGHVHMMELLALDGNVYYYCDCNHLFKKEKDGYVEVSFSVLDAVAAQKQEGE